MKKLWIGLVILVVVVVVVLVGIRFATRTLTGERLGGITEKAIERVAEKAKELEEKAPAEEVEVTTEEAKAPAKEVSTGKMNDDIYVEIMAQNMYITVKYASEAEKVKTTAGQLKLAEKMGKEMEAVYKKFGVTEDEYSAYYDKRVEGNPEHYMKLMERISKRVEELEKAGK